jgi:hypothetical protein
MPISEWIEKLGRVIFESPFGVLEAARDAPELAEIRLAVLDEVKARSHRVGDRDVFPYNAVRIRLNGVPEEQAKVFTGKFFAQFCEQELRAGLAKSNYRFPEDLEVEVETTPTLPGPKDRWLVVEAESRPRPAVEEHSTTGARLAVVRGVANHAGLALEKTRTNIGRTTDVYRKAGPSRRNDLAFDESDEISRTVSREHAHIVFDRKAGECRLFNDRSYQPETGKPDSNCGLWIIRDGLSHEVHRGERGVRLEPGDEIHLGRAVVRFMAEPAGRARVPQDSQ